MVGLLAMCGAIMAGSVQAAGEKAAKEAKKEGVPCYGVNACKGTGGCGSKNHSCAGKNGC